MEDRCDGLFASCNRRHLSRQRPTRPLANQNSQAGAALALDSLRWRGWCGVYHTCDRQSHHGGHCAALVRTVLPTNQGKNAAVVAAAFYRKATSHPPGGAECSQADKQELSGRRGAELERSSPQLGHGSRNEATHKSVALAAVLRIMFNAPQLLESVTIPKPSKPTVVKRPNELVHGHTKTKTTSVFTRPDRPHATIARYLHCLDQLQATQLARQAQISACYAAAAAAAAPFGSRSNHGHLDEPHAQLFWGEGGTHLSSGLG